MSTEPQFERLSDYERAICYFTLPSIQKPLPNAVYILYAMAALAATLSLALSLRSDMRSWTVASVTTLAALIVGGGALFFIRALRLQIRQRAALADAEGVPNAESGFEANLDPFDLHTLACRPWERSGSDSCIWDRKGNLLYRIETSNSGQAWTVEDVVHGGGFGIRGSGSVSFSVSSGTPRTAHAFRDDEALANVAQQRNWGRSLIQAELCRSPENPYTIQSGEIRYGGGAVGRVYYMRRSAYLDIQSEHLNEATLTYFIAMT